MSSGTTTSASFSNSPNNSRNGAVDSTQSAPPGESDEGVWAHPTYANSGSSWKTMNKPSSQETTDGDPTSSSEVIEGTPPKQLHAADSSGEPPDQSGDGQSVAKEKVAYDSTGAKPRTDAIAADFFDAPTQAIDSDLNHVDSGDIYASDTRAPLLNGGGDEMPLDRSTGVGELNEMGEHLDAVDDDIGEAAALIAKDRKEATALADEASKDEEGDGMDVADGETESELEAINDDKSSGNARELISNQKLAKQLEGHDLMTEVTDEFSSNSPKHSSRNKTVSTTSDHKQGEDEDDKMDIGDVDTTDSTPVKKNKRVMEDDKEASSSKRAKHDSESKSKDTQAARTGLRERRTTESEEDKPASVHRSGSKKSRSSESSGAGADSNQTPTKNSRNLPERVSKKNAYSAVVAASVSSDSDSDPGRKQPSNSHKKKPDRASKSVGGSSKKSKHGSTPHQSSSKSTSRERSDPYDVDNVDHDDQSPSEPLRHVHMARDNFGGFRFQIKNKDQQPSGSKYSHLSRNSDHHKSGDDNVSPAPSSTSKHQRSDLSTPDAGDAELQKSSKKKKKSTEKKSATKARNKRLALFSDMPNDADDIYSTGEPSDDGAADSGAEERRRKAHAGRTPATGSKSSKKISAYSIGEKFTRPKSEYNLPETPEEQVLADFPIEAGSLMPGARVLARWRDGTYYPGHVLFRDGLGRYKVRFLDRFVRDMPAPDVFAIALLEKNNVLMVNEYLVEENDEELRPIKILKCPDPDNCQEWYKGIFHVYNRVTDQEEFVSWEKMRIDKEQASNYVQSLVNRAAQDIVTDNILTNSSRARRSRQSFVPAVSGLLPDEDEDTDSVGTGTGSRRHEPTPKKSHKKKKVSVDRGSHDASSTHSVTPPPPIKSSKKSKSSSKKPPQATSSKKKSHAGRPKAKVAEPVDQVEESEGEGVEGQPFQIFAGLSFVLTSANRKPPAGEAEEENRPQFNKKIVRTLIIDRGGTVMDDFSSVEDRFKCLLVADTHYRTHKYLSALARAIPCVSHMWIHDCCQQGKLLPYMNFMLPAGNSIETKGIVDWHESCPTLLKDMTVLVYTDHRPTNPQAMDFVQIWAPLVRCMGATVLDTQPKSGKAPLDILLTDSSCPPPLLGLAEEKGAIVVSSEWLIQAIITGERPDPAGQDKYRYDYTEPLLVAPGHMVPFPTMGGPVGVGPAGVMGQGAPGAAGHGMKA